MQIAVEGCCHGDLDKIYATLQAMEVAENRTIDLLICCGDFQVFVLTLQNYPPLPGKRRQGSPYHTAFDTPQATQKGLAHLAILPNTTNCWAAFQVHSAGV